MKLVTISGWVLLGLPLVVQAQQATAPDTQAKLADCVRDIKGDSVALYFNAYYELTPMACATFCRYTHLGPKGSLYGEVRDYRLATKQLAYRQHYANGVRQGSYEAYYPNGQLQVRGTYEQGAPSGEWQFWYASGKPRQVLRWNGAGAQPWRFVACWDSTGQQLLANGTGHWREVDLRLHHRIEGQVVNEQPQGEWQMYHLDFEPARLLGTETYERGVFKKGHSIAQMGSFTYRDQSHFIPAFDDPSDQATLYKRGVNCEELASRRKGIYQLGNQKVTFTNPIAAKNLTQAHPEGDASAYLRMLLQKLSGTASMTALLRDPQYTAEVDADVDELGKLGNFRSTQVDIQRVFTQIVPPLGRWYAATANGQPARSHVRFRLSVLDQQWQVRYSTSGIELGKPHAPQP